MNCWWESGYWMGWHWLSQVFWLLLLAAVGYLFYRAIAGRRLQPAAGPSLNKVQPTPSGERCPNCHASVRESYLCCPECHYKLKTNCPSCGKLVKTKWDICPYCEAEIKTETKSHN